MITVSNTSETSLFFDAATSKTYSDWRDFINIDSVATSSKYAHIKNSLTFRQEPSSYTPVIGKIYPIPPKSSWIFTSHSIAPSIKSSCVEFESKANLDSFLSLFKKISRRIDCSDIAIELSGGLDSSLIISLAKEIGIDPILIGFKSDRWEFRTERQIQNLYASSVKRSHLIDYESVLPFSDLLSTPLHPLPDNASLHHNGHNCIAKFAVSNGATVVLNGIGIEPFLVESFIDDDKFYLQRLTMENVWANEHVFLPKKISYLNVAKLKPVYSRLMSLRRGLDLDRKKIWAREHFASVLPRELSEYRFKAAFDGIFQSGLIAEQESIQRICDVTFAVTGDRAFKSFDVEYFISNASLLKHSEYTEFIATLSYASWINSLVREKLI